MLLTTVHQLSAGLLVFVSGASVLQLLTGGEGPLYKQPRREIPHQTTSTPAATTWQRGKNQFATEQIISFFSPRRSESAAVLTALPDGEPCRSGALLQRLGRGGETGAQALQQPTEEGQPGPRKHPSVPPHHERGHLRQGRRRQRLPPPRSPSVSLIEDIKGQQNGLKMLHMLFLSAQCSVLGCGSPVLLFDVPSDERRKEKRKKTFKFWKDFKFRYHLLTLPFHILVCIPLLLFLLCQRYFILLFSFPLCSFRLLSSFLLPSNFPLFLSPSFLLFFPFPLI